MATWEIGLIQGLMPFLGLISKLLLSFLADRYNGHKIIMAASISLWAIGYEFMLLIPGPKIIPDTPDVKSLELEKRPNDNYIHVNESLEGTVNSTTPSLERHHLLFFYSFTCLMIINLAFAPIFSLFDAMSFNILVKSNSHSSFGTIRAWAAAGYMIFSPISGMGMTHLGESYKIKHVCFLWRGKLVNDIHFH